MIYVFSCKKIVILVKITVCVMINEMVLLMKCKDANQNMMRNANKRAVLDMCLCVCLFSLEKYLWQFL